MKNKDLTGKITGFDVRKKKSPPPGPAPQPSRNKQRTQPKAPHAQPKSPAIAPKSPALKGTMLYGHHAIEAAWHNPERRFHALYVADGSQPEWLIAALDRKATHHPAPVIVPRTTLDLMTRDAVHQGIVADVSPLPELDIQDILAGLAPDAGATLLMLDQVSDPQNIGSILRAAAAFGARAVIAQARHAPPVTASMAKIASGAVEHVPYIQVTNLSRCLEQLAEHDFISFGFDERGTGVMGQVPLPARHVLAMGAEGSGLRRLVAEHCHQIIRLPTRPPIASLNVAQAATIALYEATRQAGTP